MVQPNQYEDENKLETISDNDTNNVSCKRRRDESTDNDTGQSLKKARVEEKIDEESEKLNSNSEDNEMVVNSEKPNNSENCKIDNKLQSKPEMTADIETKKNESGKEDIDSVMDQTGTKNSDHTNENNLNEVESNTEQRSVNVNENTIDNLNNAKKSTEKFFNDNYRKEDESENVTNKSIEKLDDEDLPDVQKEKKTELESSQENIEKSKTQDEYQSEDLKGPENPDIINGMELTVECASDKESSSENETVLNSKPKIKTIIVREKPNDSEVDESSSEAEKSDSYKIIEPKSKLNKISTNSIIPTKQTKKKPRKRSSFSKVTTSESENTLESNSDDEDYSPVLAEKQKKTQHSKKPTLVKTAATNKENNSTSGSTSLRSKPSANSYKVIELSDSESEKQTESTQERDSKKVEKKQNKSGKSPIIDEIQSNNGSTSELSNNESENEKNNSEKSVKSASSRAKTSNRNLKKIEDLKKYIRAAGIKVKCYNTLLKDCKTDAAKAKRLNEFLMENGMVGTPTFKKCESLKIKNESAMLRIKNESAKEIQDLDKTAIISESRPRRSRVAKKSQPEDDLDSLKEKSEQTFKKV